MQFTRRGCTLTPKEPVTLTGKAKVSLPVYTRNNKKYIDLELFDNNLKSVQNFHESSKKFFTKDNVMDPLEGSTLKIKIPFRYNQVTCKVMGPKTIQELVKGDIVTYTIQYCGVWTVGDYCGTSWKLNLVET